MRTAASRVAVVVCVILLLAACGGGGTAGRTAAQRFDDAVALIAKALGKTTTEVEAGIKTRLPTASADDLAAQAERTAARTAEMERLAAVQAQAAAREAAMVETLYGATCDYVVVAYELAALPLEQRESRFTAILVEQLEEHLFDTGPSNVASLRQAVIDLWDSVSGNSTQPLSKIATDLACFAS